MGFPFLAPLSPWTVEVLKEREESTFDTAFRNPYVILTSGALVVKGIAKSEQDARNEEIKDLINTPPNYPNAYKGCIISNNSNNIGLSYQTGKTIIGIDFDGKPIEVDNENGRKVSTPIIESVEIDTDGANNTLKTARINIICFTLKQLEMFELFFMKPGMNVLIEYGDSSLLKKDVIKYGEKLKVNSPQLQKRKWNRYRNGKQESLDPFTRPEEALIEKTNNYQDFCENFSQYYRSDTNAIIEYLNRVEKSLGTYDLVAGKVLDYSFSIGEGGVYQIQLEVSQGNQVSLAIPQNPNKKGSKTSTPIIDKNIKPYDQIMELIAADFNLDKENLKKMLSVVHPLGKNITWEKDWFNFLKVNKEQKDTVASKDAYISLRFILKILMNYILVNGNVDETFFSFHLPVYNKKAANGDLEMDGNVPKQYNVLPITSNKFIMSSSDEIIFPSKELPTIVAPIQPKENEPELSDEENVIKIGSGSVDGTINGYSFHTPETYAVPDVQPYHYIAANPKIQDERIGDALNIFLKYESVVKLWNKTQTRIDFLEGALNMINSNSYGLFRLVYGCQIENSPGTIVDYKHASRGILEQNAQEEIYRFKPTGIKSIVKNFSFNFQMSNLVAGRTLFNSNKALAEAKAKAEVGLTDAQKKNIKTEKLELPSSAYKSIDNSTFANADGWYSINNVELKRIEANFIKAKQNTNTTVSKETESKTVTKEAKNLTDVVNSKSIKFILDSTGKKIEPLIYKDPTFIQDYITQAQAAAKTKKSTLSPIDVTLTIDGFSGFRCGQYFNIDGIPEIYNQIGVFQITNTKHNIQKDGGWITTIEAGFRIIDKKKN
jgi:hypothetical protein